MIDRRSRWSITCSSLSVSTESFLDMFREVPMGGCKSHSPWWQGGIKRRGLFPSISENFLRTIQANRTRPHSLAANAGVSPPVLHLRILRHWYISWAVLATVLGTGATTGGVGVNTKTHWSLHAVRPKEELDASRCLTWDQRWRWWQLDKAPLLLLCSSPWGYPCPSPALWSWCQTGPHRKEIPPLAHRDKLPQIHHSSHSGWQKLSHWDGLQVKK